MVLRTIRTIIFFLVFCGNTWSQSKLADAAIELIDPSIIYNPAYFSIDYPNGDIPEKYGVCTDLVIRAYRKLGIDLQELVHEDMQVNFSVYPTTWGLNKPDRNIDHRRVPNLMVFFELNGEKLPISNKPYDYKPGDIVCWNLGNGVTHIGIVVNKKSNNNSHYLIVHNIGNGQVMEDCLFRFEIIGHYRYPEPSL